MIAQVFAVYDSKAQAFAQPFFSQSTVTAARAFSDAAADPNTMLHKHPEDFTLHHLGSFDDATGFLDPLVAPINLGKA